MAYKRKTTKTSPTSRKSVTYNTNGPSTFSHSNSGGGGVTYTHTSKGGKYYTTRTQKFANGYVERKRVMSSSPKKTASPKRRKGNSDSGFGALGLIALGIIILISLAFGG